MRRAVYPGSFDPITLGHIDIIERISRQFDEVIVLVTSSSQKNYLFDIKERKDLIQKTLGHLKNIKIDHFDGLTVEYAKKAGAQCLVRGLRAVVDFEYELTMANFNQKLHPEVETLLVFAHPEFYYISSRGVKELARHDGELKHFVSPVVGEALKKKI